MQNIEKAKTTKERVKLGERSYNILIGQGQLKRVGAQVGKLSGRCLVVTNRKVYKLHGKALEKGLDKAGIDHSVVMLADGEKSKTMASVEQVHDRLVLGRYDRDSVVIGFGGGVIGDMAGFAAATYMRGCLFAQVPTTLLAQVDSSVGGKTGVNHRKGKNLIGAFYQPSVVMADVDALKSLPHQEILCGVAEVIKYGLIASPRFFRWLVENMKGLLALKAKETMHAVSVSCRTKAEVVSEDEREADRRAILNFGHTVGHAIEAVTEYKKYRHGYAVAMGMRAAAELSQIKEGITEREVSQAKALIASSGLPATIPKGMGDAALMGAMRHDKKVRSGTIRFALLDGIGKCRIRNDVTDKEIKEALRLARYD